MNYNQRNNGILGGFGFKDNIIADLSLIDIISIGGLIWAVKQVSTDKVLSDTDEGLQQNDTIIKQNELLIKQNQMLFKILSENGFKIEPDLLDNQNNMK